MTHDHPDLIALIRSRGGSLSVRQLQHARRIYRHSADDARAALASIADTGIASWSPDGRTLTLHEQHAENLVLPLGTMPPAPTSALDPSQVTVSNQHNTSERLPITFEQHNTTAHNPPEVRENPDTRLPKNPDTLTGDNATGNVADAGGTPSDDDEKPTRPRDRLGLFLPGPVKPKTVPANGDPAPEPSSGQVVGLATLPAEWPQLPPNASLAAEVSWVQSSRLDVVQQVPGGYRVDLSRADRPAPSKGALSWLETSILFPSKFADVSVKAAQGATDEQEEVRRERIAIEEVRALLAEMLDDPAAG